MVREFDLFCENKKSVMNLFFRKLGEGPAIVVLHGVFGSSDNLYTACKSIAEAGFTVYSLDARNHGQSDHEAGHSYENMAADLNDFLKINNIENPIILGHSMGGKTALKYTQAYENFSKLIVVDIAPRFYKMHHMHILEGLNAINLEQLNSRKDAEDIFANYVNDAAERQFILKNLFRNDAGGFSWRINLPVLTKEILEVGIEIELNKEIAKPTLIIRGSESNYVSNNDFEDIKKAYTNAKLVTIEGANHWVHATNHKEFVDSVVGFCKE